MLFSFQAQSLYRTTNSNILVYIIIFFKSNNHGIYKQFAIFLSANVADIRKFFKIFSIPKGEIFVVRGKTGNVFIKFSYIIATDY